MLTPMHAYVLTEKRDRETIERFLDMYVNRETSIDRGNENLYVRPLNWRDEDLLLMNRYDREPAIDLSHVISLGLAVPRRAFCLYLDARRDDIRQAALGFTTDDCLVLGLGVESHRRAYEATMQAKILLNLLVDTFDCRAGLIAVEQAPPSKSEVFWTGKGIAIPILMWHEE